MKEIEVKKKPFDEMISNFNRTVSEWDIDQKHKIELLGWITCIGYEHERTLKQERKTGKWMVSTDNRCVKCSECGLVTTRNEIRGIALFGKDEPYYCPNCGAKMEK